jgi:hypothetical protein
VRNQKLDLSAYNNGATIHPVWYRPNANGSITTDQARSSFDRDVRFSCEKEEGSPPMSGTAPLLVVETLIFVIIGFHRFPK